MKRTTIFLTLITLVCLAVGGAIASVQQTDILEIVLGNLQITDDYKFYFGNDNDASLEYDEDGTDQLRVTGSTIFEDAVAFDSALTFTGGYTLPDDVALTLGTDSDGSIEYDEDGTDQVRFTGAAIFEDAIEFDGALDIDSTVALGAVMTVADDIAFTLGTDADATIMYDELTDDALEITATSITLAGAVDATGAVGMAAGGTIPDDIAFTLGTDSDATIMYDELTDDALEITATSITLAGAVDVTGAIAATGAVGMAAGGTIPDDIAMTFGTDLDVTIEYDENGTDQLRVAGAAIFEDPVDFSATPLFSTGTEYEDDQAATFGADADATILYDETTDDALEITSTKITLTGAIAATGAVVGTSTITSSAAGTIGWSVVAAGNQACTTTCTSACVYGYDDGTTTIVDCASAIADKCVCAGAS